MKLKFWILRKKADILASLILAIVTLVVWFPLTKGTITSQGFDYLNDGQQRVFWANFPYSLAGYETSANLFGKALIEIFNVNFVLYFWTELVLFVIVVISFYIFVRVLTRNLFISFLAALILSASYFGNFDMLGAHCYCFYMERVVGTPFLLFSLTFLHIFLTSMRYRFFAISLGLFILGNGLSHFGMLFTAPFLFYPIFWFILQGKRNISKVKLATRGIVLGSSYVAASGFLSLIQYLYEGNVGPIRYSFWEFLLNPWKYDYLEKIVRQFTYWSHYSLSMLQNWNAPKLLPYVRDAEDVVKLIPIVLIAYFIVSIIIYKKFSKLRPFLLTILFSLLGIFFLNAWFGEYHMLTQISTNRYLYYPTFLFAIFWALFLFSLFKNGGKIKKIITIFIVIAYLFINQKLVSEAFREEIMSNGPTQKMYDALIEQRSTLSNGTLVVGSYPEMDIYSANFFTQRLGRGEVVYKTENLNYEDDWRIAASSSAHVVKTYYEPNCNCIKEERPR